MNGHRKFCVSTFKVLPLFLTVLVAGHVRSRGATNDLVITSIAHSGECTMLTWNSQPGAYYNVLWMNNLVPPIFWRRKGS